MIKTFKDFCKDYKLYYKDIYIRITNENAMCEVCCDLYNLDKFEIDYENEVIEIY